MTTQIRDQFNKLNIVITDKRIEQLETQVTLFETRQNAPLALNSPLLGVHRIYFLPSDREALFHMFGVTEKQIADTIKKIPLIVPTRKVVSDPFNVFAFWLMHLGYTQLQDNEKRHHFLFNIAKFVHYKFFTSLVNYAFPHGAVEKNMVATVNSLTRKYDIVIYGTWKKTLEARCLDLIDDENSIHTYRLKTAYDDIDGENGFLYVITDTQTRLRDKIGNIRNKFYEIRAEGGAITNRMITAEVEGEKMLIDTVSTFDTAISTLCSEVLSVNLFLDRSLIISTARLFPNISVDMLRSSLIGISEIASSQALAGLLDKVDTVHHDTIYVGIRVLISNIIQKSYRYCMKQHINLSNKVAVYKTIRNVYASSRISDPDIITVKNSIAELTERLGRTKRDTTKSSLRLAILSYLIFKSFRSV